MKQMGARFLVVGTTISLCLVSTSDRAQAQTAGDSEVLPAIEVVAPPPPAGSRPTTRTSNRGAPRATTRNVRRVLIYPTSPSPTVGSGTDVDKVPSAINAVGAAQIARTDSLNVADALQQQVPGVFLSDTTGNPFMPDVQFRGFVASPVAGTPQGLAVYQNGTRINEAFGDVVNWDLIPTAAIRSVTVVTNNPAFGLNALGGAVNVQMKDGFNYKGAETSIMGGSFGRIQGSAQAGKQVDNWAVYGALEGLRENGFRNFSQSTIRRFYGDVGYRTDVSEFHLNFGVAKNNFGASAAVPVELLQKYWGATYTTPQTTDNRVAYANLTGKVEVTPTWTLEGSARVRAFRQKTVDGNPTETEPCAADPGLLCFNDDDVPANGLNGVQLANPFPTDAVLGQIDRTTTRSTTTGATLQATNTDQIFGHNNQFMVGGSFDSSITRFGASAELGTISPNYVVNGSGIFLGRSGEPVSIGPVSLRATNRYTGLYALDTFDVTDRFSLSGGGRFNYATVQLQDLIGTDLNGNHTFSRFNPMVGGTYKINSGLTAYAGYSEANRAPTPLELACADPARPCIVAAFLIADPPLKQVVSRTIEAGFRGSSELNFGTLGWKVGAFSATNADDILAIPSPEIQGFGYFQNVGRTRRQGIEAQVNVTSKALQMYASYTLVDARFLDPLTLNSRSPFADADGNIQVQPGNRIPSIPRNRLKFGVDYWLTDALKIGGDALLVTSQFFAGDESNQAIRLPGYSVFNLHASYQINETYQLFGRVDNVFDKRYSTFGTFFETGDIPNFANNGDPFTDSRTVTPARPRAFYAGLKAKW